VWCPAPHFEAGSTQATPPCSACGAELRAGSPGVDICRQRSAGDNACWTMRCGGARSALIGRTRGRAASQSMVESRQLH